jgi:UDP-N-acetylmuramate dehydrogenase
VRAAERFVSALDPDELRRVGFRGRIETEVPLAPYTTWRIGGPAEVLATPVDADDLASALAWARARGIPWRVLGNGSNLLVRDDGVRGLVVRVRKVLDALRADGTVLHAGAGALFPAVANRAADLGLAGIEFGAGIPGTIGGAVVMNAGWHEHEIGNVIDTVDVVEPESAPARLTRDACAFRYRGSRFRDRPCVVVGATLRLVRDDPGAIRARLEAYATSRKRNQPTEQPSCGSVFLKPAGDFAGRLIEAAGLKGLRVGDVEVSSKHANFFVNVGHARAADVLALVERVEREVVDRFGVQLEREFELW